MAQRYETYKDSGVQWLGEIPSHWGCLPFRRIATIKSNLVHPADYLELPQVSPDCIEKDSGRLISWKTVADSNVESDNHHFYKGQIIYSKIRPLLNKVIIAPFDGLCSADMYPIETTTDTRYLKHYMLSNPFLSEVRNVTRDRVKMPKINREELGQIHIVVPSLTEQKAIVSYLDTKCSQLDKMLEGKQKQIDLLSEMKQRVIADAVTSGLNPDVKMKATNIPWLPEIPEHWDIKRGKFLFNTINDISTTGQEELLTVSDRTGITPRSMKNVTMFMSESLVGYKKCKVGDICSNIMWMWHGAIGVTKYDGVISPSYVVYRQRNKYFLDEYLDKLLRLPQLVKWYSALSKGLTESRLRLYPDSFLNILFYVPPISEQQAIVSYIQERITKIDLLASKLQQEIENIKEYKQRLISDVVTGQIKVC